MKKMIQKMKKAQIKMNHEKKKYQMKLKLQMKKMIQKMKKNLIQKYRIYKQIQEIMQMKIPTTKIQLKNLRILLVEPMVDDEVQAILQV
jgi:hypothetical protein